MAGVMVYMSALCLALAMVMVAESACVVDEIPVKQDFDMSKMYGPWYEIYWASTQWEIEEYVWFDFVEVWGETEGDADTVSVKAYGRPQNATECGTFDKVYEKSQKEGEKDVKAKWITYVYINETYSQPIDSWIIGTDYTSWALVYGCTLRNATTGECDHPIGWIWSREAELSAAGESEVTALLPSLCVTLDNFRAMPPGTECERGETSGSAQLVTSLSVLLLPIILLHY